MKKLLFLLAVLFAWRSQAQTIQFLGTPTTQIYIRGQLRVDSIVYLPLRDTTFTPSQVGALVVKSSNGGLYLWNGLKWNTIPVGSTAWGTLTGSIASQTDLIALLNGYQPTLTAGYGVKLVSNTLSWDSANVRKVDTVYRTDDSTITYAINGHTYSVLIRGTAAGGINSLIFNVPGVLYTSPIVFSNTGGAWSGTEVLNSQTSNTFLGGPASGSPAQPTFRNIVLADIPTGIPNANLQNSAINLSLANTGTVPSWGSSSVALGGTAVLNVPYSSSTTDGILSRTDWTNFNNATSPPVTSVNSQLGAVVIGNADSIKKYPVDTSSHRQGYVLTFDSTNHKWILAAGSGSSGTVTSVALTVPSFLTVGGSPITAAGTLAVSTINQSANTIFAGPATGSSAAPGFRSVVNADLPTSGVTPGTYNSVTVNAQGIATAGSVVGAGITSLNGLTGGTQTFATGTSGSDFNISSVGTTHTFNIPDGTGVNRGAITSADWSTFNAKQAAGDYITALTGDIVAAGPGSAASTIQSNAVTTTKINNNAVTYAKIQAASTQALLGASAAGNFGEITLGTNLSMTGSVLNASTAFPSITNYSYRGKLGISDTILQYSIYNVLDFGIKGDSTADITSSLQSLVNLIPAGSTIYFPPGKYRQDSKVTINKSAKIQGSVGPIISSVTGSHSAAWSPGKTTIYFGSATDSAFYVSAGGTQFEQLCIVQANGVTPTASVGIVYNNASDSRLNNVGFMGFNINADVESGFEWVWNDCFFYGPKKYNVLIRDTAIGDAGDQLIKGCYFYSALYNSSAHIRYESGGGLKVIGNKFNVGSDNKRTKYALDVAINKTTVDLVINGNSIENFDSTGIFIHPSILFGDVVISSNQISAYSPGSYDRPNVYLDGTGSTLTGVTIDALVMTGNGSLDTAILVNNVSNLNIGVVTARNFKKNMVFTGTNTNVGAQRFPYGNNLTGTSPIMDLNSGNFANYTLGAADTINFANYVKSEPFTLLVTQDATGGRTLLCPGCTNVAQGTALIGLNPGSNTSTLIDGYFSSPTSPVITRVTHSYSNYSIPYWDPVLGLAEDNANLKYYSPNASLVVGTKVASSALGQLVVSTDASNFTPSASFERHIGSALGPSLLFVKSRGTSASPTAVVSGDYNHIWFGYFDGSGNRYPASIGSVVDSAVSSSSVPTRLYFQTGYATNVDPIGTADIKGTVDHIGRWGFGKNQLTDTALMTLGGAFGTFNNGAAGNVFSMRTNTITNWSTGTTTADYSLVGLRGWTLAASQTNTYTDASTLYIENAPAAGTNVTITNPLSFKIKNGSAKFAPATTAGTSINIPSGTAPTSPVHGDVWTDASHIYARLSGTTYQLDQQAGSGVTTVGSFSGSSQTNGASISTNTITFGPADATNPGMMSTGTQTFAGTKTFNSGPIVPTQSLGTNNGTVASTGYVDGSLNLYSAIKLSHTIFTPTTGSTVSLVNRQYNIINPAGALLALTVNLPSSPTNNDVVFIKFTQNVTTVTYANGTVVDGITAPTAGGLTVLTYDSGTTSWY